MGWSEPIRDSSNRDIRRSAIIWDSSNRGNVSDTPSALLRCWLAQFGVMLASWDAAHPRFDLSRGGAKRDGTAFFTPGRFFQTKRVERGNPAHNSPPPIPLRWGSGATASCGPIRWQLAGANRRKSCITTTYPPNICRFGPWRADPGDCSGICDLL